MPAQAASEKKNRSGSVGIAQMVSGAALGDALAGFPIGCTEQNEKDLAVLFYVVCVGKLKAIVEEEK